MSIPALLECRVVGRGMLPAQQAETRRERSEPLGKQACCIPRRTASRSHGDFFFFLSYLSLPSNRRCISPSKAPRRRRQIRPLQAKPAVLTCCAMCPSCMSHTMTILASAVALRIGNSRNRDCLDLLCACRFRDPIREKVRGEILGEGGGGNNKSRQTSGSPVMATDRVLATCGGPLHITNRHMDSPWPKKIVAPETSRHNLKHQPHSQITSKFDEINSMLIPIPSHGAF